MKAKCAVLILLASGCSGQEIYKQAQESWIGRPKHELIESWGPPDYEGEFWIEAAAQNCSGLSLFFMVREQNIEITDSKDLENIKSECIEKQRMQWGLSGTVSYRWEKVRNYPGVPSSYRATITGNTITLTPFGGVNPSREHLYCYVQFEIDRNGLIKSAVKNGNDC